MNSVEYRRHKIEMLAEMSRIQLSGDSFELPNNLISFGSSKFGPELRSINFEYEIAAIANSYVGLTATCVACQACDSDCEAFIHGNTCYHACSSLIGWFLSTGYEFKILDGFPYVGEERKGTMDYLRQQPTWVGNVFINAPKKPDGTFGKGALWIALMRTKHSVPLMLDDVTVFSSSQQHQNHPLPPSPQFAPPTAQRSAIDDRLDRLEQMVVALTQMQTPTAASEKPKKPAKRAPKRGDAWEGE